MLVNNKGRRKPEKTWRGFRLECRSHTFEKRKGSRCDGTPCNCSTWEVEAGGLQVPGQPGLYGETLSQTNKWKSPGMVATACIPDTREAEEA
jgi:hypothetical protein